MKKMILKTLLFTTMLVLLAIGVSAAAADDVNLTHPIANYYGGSLTIAAKVSNATGAGGSVVFNMTNTSFYYRLTGGSWTLIGTDATDNTTEPSTTFHSQSLVDTSTYDFKVDVISNQSGAGLIMATETVSAKYPDNTVPACSSPSPADGTKDVDGKIEFSITCSNTSSAVMYIEGTEYTMTESSDTCTSSLLTIPTNGFHSWYTYAYDGLNYTACTTYQVEVRKPGGIMVDGELDLGGQQQAPQGTTNNTLKFIAVAGILWYAFSGKGGIKKKKKR